LIPLSSQREETILPQTKYPIAQLSPTSGVYLRNSNIFGSHYNIRTVFKTKHSLKGTLMAARKYRDFQQTRQCVCGISFDCADVSAK
jgi:hypothetical protein